MSMIDVFNGDADGICALHQLRLQSPSENILVTGVKRDIYLLRRVDAAKDDHVTVLDISLDKNRVDLQRLLDGGVQVSYFDHHFAGKIPEHPNLDAHIDTSSDVCTSLLVNGYLKGQYVAWAVTAAFGDNLADSAYKLSSALAINNKELNLLQELGTYINYNGYGSRVDDLFFHPAELYIQIKPFKDPFIFINESLSFAVLKEGYAEDMAKAAGVTAEIERESFAVFVLPDSVWSRRVSGVFANNLANNFPDRAHAILTRQDGNSFVVSVRAPLSNKTGADEVCRQFKSGGGRMAAAGINNLPQGEFDNFVAVMGKRFGG